jgi:hypothetical protein
VGGGVGVPGGRRGGWAGVWGRGPRPLATVPSFASVILLLACNDAGEPHGGDASSGSSTSSTSSSTSDTRGDSTTGSLDTTAAVTGSATGDSSSSSTTSPLDDTSTSGSSSSGPGESSSSSESTGSPPANGCSDGEREALEDELVYPNIAACAGGWTVPGVVVNVTNCDREGGDDGLNAAGTECSVEDLCSEGWHVCLDKVEVMDDGVANCNDDTISWGGNSFYATRQSGGGSNNCDPMGLNDVFGCGDVGHTMINNCAPLNRGSANLCVDLPAPPWECGVSNTMEAQFIVKGGPEFGGVLCCRD